MTHDEIRALRDSLFLRLTAELAAAGCREPQIAIELRDTDMSPLQPLIGDHLVVVAAGVIRIADAKAPIKGNPDPLPIGRIIIRNTE